MKCCACRRRDATVGVLCERCCDDLSSPIAITPQQIELHAVRPTASALIDAWGQPHHLDPVTTIGRSVASPALVILEGSVSRKHAEITRKGSGWLVRDLGSTCGTFVDGRPIEDEVALRDGARVRFGDVSFFLVEEIMQLPPRWQATDPATVREAGKPTRELTRPGRPVVRLELHAPVGGGGGVVVIEGKQVQLTTAQYELIAVLVDRMRTDAAQPDEIRGFVPLADLMRLSLEVSDPGEDHIRQLVRRVRRTLEKAEVGDLIEARRGAGYRLRVIPRS